MSKTSKPKVYDKAKWDTSLGLDYSGWRTAKFGRPNYNGYVHSDFPPLFKNTKLISQYDLEGKGDGFQLAKQGNYVYFCHFNSSGLSVVDVSDLTKPEVVKFIPLDSPQMHGIKCRVLNDILITSQEWKFFWAGPSAHAAGPEIPIQPGIKIYSLKDPADPKLLSFFPTGQWTKEGGDLGNHRFWYDGHYAYLAAAMPGFDGNIMVNVDVSDPKNPKEVSKFWLPGQWTAGGERKSWIMGIHHPTVQGDRAYAGWFDLGPVIIDISNIKRPTLVWNAIYDKGGQNHTFLPIKDRKFAFFDSEYRYAWMLDISDEKYPKIVGMFPKPPAELLKRGSGYTCGPSIHNIHENTPGPDSFRSDDILYTACGPAGMRVYDMSDPYRIEEIGYYVPGTPKVYYDPRGPEHAEVGAGVDLAEVYVDKKGLLYCSSYNNGLEILEFTG